MELIKICSVIDYRWRTHDAIAECVTDVLSTFWRQHKIYLFYIIKKHTIISRSFNITRKPAFTHFGVICNLTLLSIQNEAMQSIAVRSKELRLVQENLITPLSNLTRIAFRRMKTYSESRTELRNPQILKKMLKKSRQFLDVALNTAGVEKIRLKNLKLRSTLKAIRFELWIKGSVSDGGNLYPLWLVVLKSVWHSIRNTIQLAVSCSELYFARCCALKRTGTFVSESKVMCLF